jgi:NACHT domain
MISRMRRHHETGDRRRAEQRARFATAMASQVSRISELEEWRDERFTELEAEVEIHGRQQRGIIRRGRRHELIQRVPSLSEALEKTSEPIVLLEGEPGSGKSVALRHVAMRLATNVKAYPTENGIIPIYLNLKEFRPTWPVDAEVVRTFIRASIHRVNDRYVDMILEQEFDRGIKEGTWLFLFDSFDEIPTILSAVEADEAIEACAGALYDFLTDVNACRGIIATREFRGPKRISWPRFRVIRVTDKQRKDLIEKLELSREVERRLLEGLETADPAVRQLADNPLFLALLCEHQRRSELFPNNSHVVFESYVARRLEDDVERLHQNFGLDADAVRAVGEHSAYCMAAHPGLGLSPSRPDLIAAMKQAGFVVDSSTESALDALEYMRLARKAESVDGGAGGFTFAHRRFQEYFATCLVLQEPGRIDPTRILTDGRWRETAVTLFQTQDEALEPLLEQAAVLLANMVTTLKSLDTRADNATASIGTDPTTSPDEGYDHATPFAWPHGSLHLLRLLQDGLPIGDQRRSSEISVSSGRLIEAGYERGQLYDRRWATEVSLAANRQVALKILRKAFQSGSGWLREAAYAQVGNLDEIPSDLRQQMRGMLAGLAAGGRLRHQRLAINAQLKRLPDPQPELFLERLFLSLPFVDAALWIALCFTCVALLGRSYSLIFAVFGIVGYGTFYLDRSARQLQSEGFASGGTKWFHNSIEALAGRPMKPVGIASLALAIRAVVASAIFTAIIAGYAKRQYAISANAKYHLELSVKGPTAIGLILVLLMTVFVFAWCPTAVRADQFLARPNLRVLFILPVTWGSWFARTRLLRRIKIMRAVITAVIGIFWVGGIWWLTHANLHVPEWLILTGVAIFGLLFLAFFGTIVWFGCKNLLRWQHDHNLLNKIERGTIACKSFADMLSVLSTFATNRALLLFVQDVKRQRLAAQYPGALRAMKVFAAELGWMGNLKLMTESLTSSELKDFKRWTDGAHERPTGASQAVMDEIGKIIADVELADLGLS